MPPAPRLAGQPPDPWWRSAVFLVSILVALAALRWKYPGRDMVGVAAAAATT